MQRVILHSDANFFYASVEYIIRNCAESPSPSAAIRKRATALC